VSPSEPTVCKKRRTDIRRLPNRSKDLKVSPSISWHLADIWLEELDKVVADKTEVRIHSLLPWSGLTANSRLRLHFDRHRRH
jgi:hypothetical protein